MTAVSTNLEALLARCAAQDATAFDALYDATASQLYGMVLRIVRSPDVADDILQDAYVKIWTQAPQYQPSLGEPMAWMSSVARYRALDLVRRRKFREDVQQPLDEVSLPPTPEEYNEVMRLLDRDVLHRCLGRLDTKASQCIVLAYCEGYSHDELSEIFETPLGTIKSWIRRGLVSLRECCDDHS